MALSQETRNRDVFVALLAGSVLSYAAYRWISGRKRKEFVGHVSRIHVYPLKSARELPGEIRQASLSKYGMVYKGVGDRHWMATSNGEMVTMKHNARLVLITTSLVDNALLLEAEGMEPLRLDIDPDVQQDRVSSVVVKVTPLPALDMGDAAADWICKVLRQTGLRLHYSAPSLEKRLSCKVPKDWPTRVGPKDQVAFQDFGHCMIMTESSMDTLNERLEKPMSVLPFRPNIMVEGSKPYDEDSWGEVYFGDQTSVRYIDNCTRCLITTIDHETAQKSKDEQPLKELKKYRCMEPYGPKPSMGIHTVVKTEGTICVGDPVYVVRK